MLLVLICTFPISQSFALMSYAAYMYFKKLRSIFLSKYSITSPKYLTSPLNHPVPSPYHGPLR